MTVRADAKRLALLLERPPAERDDVEGLAELARLADLLAASAEEIPPPDAVFRDRLRDELVAAARDRSAARATVLGRLRGAVTAPRWSARTAAVGGVAAMALSSGGVALAAEQALPGDTLYAVKLGLEDLRVALLIDPAARGDQLLSYARDRIVEARAVHDDPAAAARALREADAQAHEGAAALLGSGDPEAGERIAAFVDAQHAAVVALLPDLSGAAAAAAHEVLAGLAEIAGQAGVDAPDAPADDEAPTATATEAPTAGTTTVTPSAPTSRPATTAPAATTPAPADSGAAAPPPGGAAGGAPPSGGREQGSGTAPVPTAPLEDPVGQVGATVGGATGPVGEAVGDAVGGATEAVEDVVDTVTDTVGGVTDAVGGAVGDVTDTVDGVVDDVTDTVEDVVDPVLPGGAGPVGDVLEGVDGLVDDTTDAVDGAVGSATDAVGGVVDGVGDVVGGLGDALGGGLGG